MIQGHVIWDKGMIVENVLLKSFLEKDLINSYLKGTVHIYVRSCLHAMS